MFVGYEGGVVEQYNIKANSVAESQSEATISLLVYAALIDYINLTAIF